MAQSRWHEFKQHLSSRGSLNGVFLDIHSTVFNTTNTYSFQPLLLSRNAKRLTELLDRSMAARKEVRELEIAAVKAEADYQLFLVTSGIDQTVDVLRLQLNSKAEERDGYDGAIGILAPDHGLQQGLSELAKGKSHSLVADLTDSSQIETLLSQRYTAVADYQKAYHSRYTTPGNAHNYGERAKFLKSVLQCLLDEAIALGEAVIEGVAQIYGYRLTPLPNPLTLERLDDFAIWVFTTSRALARAADTEFSTDLVVPLVQVWFNTGASLVSARDFDKAVADSIGKTAGQLKFSFPRNSFIDDKARLRGIGVSFGNKSNLVGGSGIDRNETVDSFVRLAIRVSSPAQHYSDNNPYNRPVITLGSVALHGTSAGSTIFDGPAVENLCPFGDWSIELHPYMVWKDGSEQQISSFNLSDRVRDLKLSLRFYTPGEFVVTNVNL